MQIVQNMKKRYYDFEKEMLVSLFVFKQIAEIYSLSQLIEINKLRKELIL